MAADGLETDYGIRLSPSCVRQSVTNRAQSFWQWESGLLGQRSKKMASPTEFPVAKRQKHDDPALDEPPYAPPAAELALSEALPSGTESTKADGESATDACAPGSSSEQEAAVQLMVCIKTKADEPEIVPGFLRPARIGRAAGGDPRSCSERRFRERRAHNILNGG